jgi:hypothetical protein
MTLPLFPSDPAPDMPDAHHCHARGCRTPVRPELLMCARHWRVVPKFVQRAVWDSYRPGQCDDKDVSRAWLRAADAAIGFVARAEGLPVREVERVALETLTERTTR